MTLLVTAVTIFLSSKNSKLKSHYWEWCVDVHRWRKRCRIKTENQVDWLKFASKPTALMTFHWLKLLTQKNYWLRVYLPWDSSGIPWRLRVWVFFLKGTNLYLSIQVMSQVLGWWFSVAFISLSFYITPRSWVVISAQGLLRFVVVVDFVRKPKRE